MPTFHFNETTSSTPEQFVAALTDFGPGRAELFGNSDDGYLEVHGESPGHADVTEGSRGTWERLDYDWSDPNRGRLLGLVLGTVGRGVLGKEFGKTVKAIEARNGQAA